MVLRTFYKCLLSCLQSPEVPLTYGIMHKVFLLGLDASVNVCCTSCLVLSFIALVMNPSGYPFLWKVTLRRSSSASRSSVSQILVALNFKHLKH